MSETPLGKIEAGVFGGHRGSVEKSRGGGGSEDFLTPVYPWVAIAIV